MGNKLHFSQCVQQDQRLIMSFAMERAFHVLQLSTDELAEWLQQEIEQNPVLDLPYSSAKELNPSFIPSKSSLYEHLLFEIALHFSTNEEKEIARYIAGSLDHNGLLTLSSDELKGKEEVLKIFQRMEPKGIGARTPQEALLIQLEDQKDSPLYAIVACHYQDLLHLRLQKIAEDTGLSLLKVKTLIQKKLRCLNPFPGKGFQDEVNPILTADVTLLCEDDIWRIEVNDSSLPPIEIHPYYLNILKEEKLSRDELTVVRRHLASGKWLIRILDRRKKTLQDIAQYLLKKQLSFFEGTSHAPIPLTMKEVAQSLSLSEATITRAIANKALNSPRGLLKFRSFFTRGLSSHSGEVSNQEAKDLLQKLIKDEKEPLSDEALSKLLLSRGIQCARRTVTKYRNELKIGSASQRKLCKL